MIVCSCQQVSDFDIELALLDILNEPEAPIPTPGGYSRARPPTPSTRLNRTLE